MPNSSRLVPIFFFLSMLFAAFAPMAAAQVTVPDLEGVVEARAYRALGREDLVVGDRFEEPSDTVAVGSVIRTDPPAGAVVPENTAIDLYISTGPDDATDVPDVVGETQAAATTAIEDAGLQVGTVRQEASLTVPAGDVISQNPEGGATVSAGSSVDLVVSTGVPEVTVPDLTQLTELTAENELEDVGLVLGAVTMNLSDAVVPGQVFDQNPVAGVTVLGGTAVNIVVSSGFITQVGEGETLVPPLAGKAGDGLVAETALSVELAFWELGLGDVTVEDSMSFSPGQVIRTIPAAGTVVAINSDIDIVIASENSTAGDPTDINGDSMVNAVDVQLVINAALGQPSSADDTDVNNDGTTDAVDVQLVINAALGGGSPR